jgi:hypothetical protein
MGKSSLSKCPNFIKYGRMDLRKEKIMENNQQKDNMSQDSSAAKAMEDKQILQEILENTRRTKNYMKWQLYITIALIVIPLILMIFILPMVMQGLGSYGSLLQ